MNGPRKPLAFPVGDDDDPPARRPAAAPPAPARTRAPTALAPQDAIVVPAAVDVFEQAGADLGPDDPPPLRTRSRRTRIWPVLAAALGVLVSLSVGLWTERLIGTLFERADWLGWVAVAAAAVAVAAVVAVISREVLALARLGSIETLRAQAADAELRNDPKAARAVVARLSALMADRPQTAAGRRALAAHDREIVDGADLIRIAEVDLLGPLDAQARQMVLDAAKRVSVVTAVSPRALVDLVYVAFEASRLIRRLSDLYGGRPGTLGFMRLARGVLAHLAVTGVIAAGDDLVHQLVGQGLASRLSAKLGEGVVNGMMTARIGLAAMEVSRPLPYGALPRPKLGDFLPLLASFSAKRTATDKR